MHCMTGDWHTQNNPIKFYVPFTMGNIVHWLRPAIPSSLKLSGLFYIFQILVFVLKIKMYKETVKENWENNRTASEMTLKKRSSDSTTWNKSVCEVFLVLTDHMLGIPCNTTAMKHIDCESILLLDSWTHIDSWTLVFCCMSRLQAAVLHLSEPSCRSLSSTESQWHG